ncbi:MAG: ribosome silencing factor [Candidatus Marinimicrobia bacterium]|nr:ribosome silencing factor [Candidatus Neomarinimicrobiota bacterium]
MYNWTKQAAQSAINKKAKDVIILDLKELTSMTDYFVICTGEVDAQVKAIADAIQEDLRSDIKPWHKEGYENLDWVLLDYIDFVVHVFQRDTRDYYNIEKLWREAPVEEVTDSED